MIRLIGKFGLTWLPWTRWIYADPTMDGEVLLLRWKLRTHRFSNLFDGNGSAFLSWRWSWWRLFYELWWWRLLVLSVEMHNVRSRTWLRKRISIADNVVSHRPALMRRLTIFCRVVPQNGSSRLMTTCIRFGRQINACMLTSVLVVICLWNWRATAFDAFVVGSVRSISRPDIVSNVHREIARKKIE